VNLEQSTRAMSPEDHKKYNNRLEKDICNPNSSIQMASTSLKRKNKKGFRPRQKVREL